MNVVELPILGIRIRFECDSPAVRLAIESRFGPWRTLESHVELVRPSSAVVRIHVEESRSVDQYGDGAFHYVAPDREHLTVSTEGARGVADARRLEATVHADASVISRRFEFVTGLVEPLVLTLLGSLDRHPLHAAAVARGDVALLLAGPSGVGKSTLSYAAQREGYDILSDDAVYVQRRPRLRVWGWRTTVHLAPAAGRHFPELRAQTPVRLPTGKRKLMGLPGGPPRRWSSGRVAVCILQHGCDTRPTLEPLTPQQVVAALTGALEEGFDLYEESAVEVATLLAGEGGWCLHVCGRPQDAVPLLDKMMEALGRRF